MGSLSVIAGGLGHVCHCEEALGRRGNLVAWATKRSSRGCALSFSILFIDFIY